MESIVNKKNGNGEKGFSLVSVVFVMLALGTMSMSLNQATSTRAVSSVEDMNGVEAFYAADGALQYVIARYFMEDTNFSDNSPPSNFTLGDATITVAYPSLATYEATVQVTAQVGNSIRQVQQDVSHALAVNKPMFSGGDVNISGQQICIWFLCLPSGYTNADIGAGGTITHPTHFWVNGTKTQGMIVNLPEVNTQALIPIATTSTHTGDLTVGPGVYDADIHATGNVTILDNTVVNGNIVSDGDITVNGDVAVIGTLAAGGSINGALAENSAFVAQEGPNGEVLPALIAEDNVEVQVQGLGTLISGLVVAGNNISITSNVADLDAFALLDIDVMIIDGATIAGNDLIIYNQRGFTLFLEDTSLLEHYAQAGSVELENWKEL